MPYRRCGIDANGYGQGSCLLFELDNPVNAAFPYVIFGIFRPADTAGDLFQILKPCCPGIVIPFGFEHQPFSGIPGIDRHTNFKHGVVRQGQHVLTGGHKLVAFKSDAAELLGAEIIGLSSVSDITIHDTLTVRMRYRLRKQVDGKCVPNFHFFTSDGSYAFVDSAKDVTRMSPGIYCAECRIPRQFLNEGAYFVGVALTTYSESGSLKVEFFDKNALTFNVLDPMDERSNRYGYAGPVPGVVRPHFDWSIVEESQ